MTKDMRGDLNEGKVYNLKIEYLRNDSRLWNFLHESGLAKTLNLMKDSIIGEFDSMFLSRYVLSLTMLMYNQNTGTYEKN